MIHRIVIELTDEIGGYEKELEHLEHVYGAEELPQGEWIFNSDSLTDDMIATHYCSICGKGAYSGHDNYCWNCGLKMKIG